tara:strand:+ start:727 stop:945 length:219 start_codon:yes stop_codon:yes gene_type:complete
VEALTLEGVAAAVEDEEMQGRVEQVEQVAHLVVAVGEVAKALPQVVQEEPEAEVRLESGLSRKVSHRDMSNK